MDRALNSEMIADALGRHAPSAMPSVEELIDLLADVEVRAFRGPGRIEEDLLRTGWYLHGIASAVDAEDLYTFSRQQRAFAVSAHILDLALGNVDDVESDRLALAFGAQVGYRRGNLDPNAVAIWRRVQPLVAFSLAAPASSPDALGDSSPDGGGSLADSVSLDMALQQVLSGSYRHLALRAGVAFLGFDVARLRQLIEEWKRNLDALAESIGLGSLQSTMFGPAQAVVNAVEGLTRFLRYGDRENLSSARQALISVLTLEAGQGDHDARWVAAHLLRIAEDLDAASLWSVLPSGTPNVVAQAFTIGAPPVMTLWPPQRDLLTRVVANPLDAETRRLLLSVPTSAGKTLLAQIMICHHLATQAGSVCYVTPLRSLGREMRYALASRLRVLQRELGGDLPDFGNLDVSEILELLDDDFESAVDVMTPERLAHLLRSDPSATLDRYSMFVIDEAHLLAQHGRGFLLESLLAMLASTTARVVLLSGVMGNAQQIAAWLDDSQPGVLFESAWRGPRRLHALLHSHVVWEAGEELPPTSKRFNSRSRFPIVGDLRVRPVEGRVHRLRTPTEHPLGSLENSIRVDGKTYRRQGTPFYRLCARASLALMPAGSLLMVLSRRDYARNAAQEVAGRLPLSVKTVSLVAFMIERLGAEHPLVACVRRGVGYHHAGLPVDVLDALEQAMRTEALDAIYATSTLTDGVNLPVRTVLICETKYEGQDPGQRLDGPRLLNAVGRAGRAGKETEGWIILAVNGAFQDAAFEELEPSLDDLSITSTLLSDQALEQLAAAEVLVADTADAIFALPPGEVADFASFTWFALSATERLNEVSSGHNLARAVDDLVGFVQMPASLKDRWLAFAGNVKRQYDDHSREVRHRWAGIGASLGSARSIDRIASSVADYVAQALPVAEGVEDGGRGGGTALSVAESLTAFERAGTLEELMSLPESGNSWRFWATPGAKSTIDVSMTDGLRAWLSGSSMSDMATALTPEIADVSWRLEQTVDAVSGTFEHYLSWTIGAVVGRVNELLAGRIGGPALPADLPYLVRYGVDTEVALRLILSGVSSRRLAHQIGRSCASEGRGWGDVRTWLRNLHIEGWRDLFGASPREVEDLANLCRSTIGNPVRRLLADDAASVALHPSLGAMPPVARVGVEMRVRSLADPIEVWSQGEEARLFGILGMEYHVDVVALQEAGVGFSVECEGATVFMRHEP